ncbi:MAG: hypothetical protein Q8J66_00885 [Methylotenera sp.]|nr:hypothetical protein [Methylotenera sp.]
MSFVLKSFLLLMVLFTQSASAGFAEKITSKSGAELPSPSLNYVAKTSYKESQKKVIAAILDAMSKNNIDVLTIDRESGRVASDYVAGPTYSAAFGLLGSNSTRYKFNVVVSRDGNKSAVNVSVKLESSGDEVESWRDVSADNKETVAKLRDWMYEIIEKQLN